MTHIDETNLKEKWYCDCPLDKWGRMQHTNKCTAEFTDRGELFGIAQITTYGLDMHRLQYTQLTLRTGVELANEILQIVQRYPEAFATSTWIKWAPTNEWPPKWSEI